PHDGEDDGRTGHGGPAEAARHRRSARILPCECSTHSSTFGRNGSIARTRRARANGSPPRSRMATYLATVFSSTPASCAAEWAQRVKSNASRISTISLPDLVTVSPDRVGSLISNQELTRPERLPRSSTTVGRFPKTR